MGIFTSGEILAQFSLGEGRVFVGEKFSLRRREWFVGEKIYKNFSPKDWKEACQREKPRKIVKNKQKSQNILAEETEKACEWEFLTKSEVGNMWVRNSH